MEKIDFKKELKHLYLPSAKEATCVRVPVMNYLMIDGKGDHDSSRAFQEAVEVLYKLSYKLKFMVKKSAVAQDYVVMPLEGLWWSEDMAAIANGDKAKWEWTLMVMQPDFITQEMVDAAVVEVSGKNDALSKVRFCALDEGTAVQTMHTGPFSEIGKTTERVHRFIEHCGSKPTGKHHEIYLSDIRKTDPKKWKTVIRQPMV